MAQSKISLEVTFERKPASLGKFFVYEIEYREGISSLYEATVRLLSKTNLPLSELSALLNTHLCLQVTQRVFKEEISGHDKAEITEMPPRSRNIKGLITHYRFLGVVTTQEDQKQCFKYELRIAPDLIRASFNQKIRTYANLSAFDLCKNLVVDYQYNVNTELVDELAFSSDLIFNQLNVSDLDFLHQLCCTTGLNYCFDHRGAVKSSASSFIPQLYFSQGFDVYVAADDGKAASGRTYFICSLDSDDNGEVLLSDIDIQEELKLQELSFYSARTRQELQPQEGGSTSGGGSSASNDGEDESSGGLDALTLYEQRVVELYLSNEFIRTKGNLPDIQSRYLTAQHLNAALNSNRASISASCVDLNIMAGVFGKLNEFYGSKALNFLVTKINLNLRFEFPPDFALGGELEGEDFLSIKFQAIEEQKQTQLGFLPACDLAAIEEILHVHDRNMIVYGTVCDAQGNIRHKAAGGESNGSA